MAAPENLAVLLYCLAVAGVYRWLMPRQLPAAKALASIFLIAQVIALIMSLAAASSKGIDFWLWDLEQEWNIPTALASTQLALAGFIALLTAWLAKREPVPARLLYAGYGALFLLLAGDEFFLLHERVLGLPRLYGICGGVFGLAALAVARRASTQSRLWQVLLLAGLAISGLGGLAIDNIDMAACGGSAILHFLGRCYDLHWLEECLEFLGAWLALVAVLGALSAALTSAQKRLTWALPLLPALWLALLWQSNAIMPIWQQLKRVEAAAVTFEGDIELHAYAIKLAVQEISARIYLAHAGLPQSQLGLSLAIIDQATLKVIASRDIRADDPNRFYMAPGYTPVYRYSLPLPFPLDMPRDRAYWVLLSLWREIDGQFQFLNIDSSDHRTLSYTQVVLGEFVMKSRSSAAPAAALAAFANGFALESANLPPCARLGETLAIDFGWRADQAGSQDLTQFLHFFGADGAIWNHDQQPLGPRLPTRLWYNGLDDSETWQMALPAELPEGDYALFTGLYYAEDMQRLPALDHAGNVYPDARVPLGNLALKPAC